MGSIFSIIEKRGRNFLGSGVALCRWVYWNGKLISSSTVLTEDNEKHKIRLNEIDAPRKLKPMAEGPVICERLRPWENGHDY
jgi:endonuclease YncB( thermonuclease family)